MKKHRMSRRRFLWSMVAAIVTPCVAWLGWTASPHAQRRAIEMLLGDLRGAREIGARYLALEPAERSADVLARHLLRDPHKIAFSVTDTAALRQALAAGRTRDFASGDTVIIDGWILARTEARLCALAAIV